MGSDESGAKPPKRLDRIRQHPTGRTILRVGVAILGALIIAIGLILVPLPGPGWLIVFAGLGVWAIEFHWARRLLTWGRQRFRLWSFWVASRSLFVRLLIGLAGLVFVSAVVWASVKLTFGVDLITWARER